MPGKNAHNTNSGRGGAVASAAAATAIAPAGIGGGIETAPVALTGRWRGAVTTACGESTEVGPLPDASQWCRILEAFVADPFALPECTTLKYVPGVEVLRGTITFDGRTLSVIAKHHTAEGIGGNLSVLFGGARARRNFDRAAALMRAGIATAMPLAMIQRTKPVRESWLLTVYVPDLIDLDRLALTELPQLSSREAARIKRRIIEATATLFLRLAQSGWHHRDLKASNIMLRHHAEIHKPAEAWLVDLDGLSRGWAKDPRREPQRLARLAASLLSYVSITRTDMARFLRVYIASTGRPRDWRTEFRLLTDDANRYIERARKRKGHKFDGYAGD